MYQTVLLQYAKDERFKAPSLSVPAITRRNPACGDEIELATGLGAEGRLEIRYAARACAVTLASAAILAEQMREIHPATALQRLEEAFAYFEGCRNWDADWGGDGLTALGEVRAFPMRMACVRLPWEAFQEGLAFLELPHS